MSRHPASFRDPSGFLFRRNGILYRQVNEIYADDYQKLMNSGLYQSLVDNGSLIPHSEVDVQPYDTDRAHLILRPEEIPFVSYPYEWCFEALKDAALLTLEIQKKALDHGMILKDASAFNIQFVEGHPIFIDTLSFETHQEGRPWPAYRQFCEHFLAPLALMSQVDINLNRLLTSSVQGIPLETASSALPFKTKLSLGLLMHVHLHAAGKRKFTTDEVDAPSQDRVSERALMGLVDNLQTTVQKLKWEPEGQWRDYYEDSSYTERGFSEKESIVKRFLERINPETVWDLGSNVGIFSSFAANLGAHVVSLDADPACVQLNYRRVKEKRNSIIPLWIDLCNPSPGVGWANEERTPLLQRGQCDAVLALALVHHLAIGNNVSLQQIAEKFAMIGKDLIVEFVPKDDPQIQRMLASREDIFSNYHREKFEEEFSQYFDIEASERIPDSGRILYLMRGRTET